MHITKLTATQSNWNVSSLLSIVHLEHSLNAIVLLCRLHACAVDGHKYWEPYRQHSCQVDTLLILHLKLDSVLPSLHKHATLRQSA